MNIVVLGAGTVGRSIAELLCEKDQNVTVVDTNAAKVERINEELDVRAIVGSASQSSILFQAGVNTADVCLAVSGNDEVNIIAASMSKMMGVRRSIARVYAPVFRDLSTFDYQHHFNIDQILSLEYLTAMELVRRIRDQSMVIVETLLQGELHVEEIIVGQEGKLTRSKIKDLGLSKSMRIGTIKRDNRMWIASAEDQLIIGDHVTVFCRPDEMKQVRSLFKTSVGPQRRVVIGGGGETGLHLAKMLEREGFKVTILETEESRCEELASILESTDIIHGDATRVEFLKEERVGNADVFVACTGDDENNMVMCVEAETLGAAKIMCLVDRPDYAKIVNRLGIDLAVSKREAMAKQILAYLTEGVVVARVKLPGGLINIIEVEIRPGSPATTSTLAELGLPDRCLVAGVIQQETVRVPTAQDRLSPGNTAVLLVEEDVVDAALARFTPVGK